MSTPTLTLYPSAPLENSDLEKRLEKKLNDVNSFKNSTINIKKRVLNSKMKIIKRKKSIKILKQLPQY